MDTPRKIQVTGKNTFIVSLPHEWVAARGIIKGQPVHLADNQDGTLTISLKGSARELRSVAIEVSESLPGSTMRNIVSAYVGGAGKIVLRGHGTYTVAEEARRILSGVEITEESGDELVLRILDFNEVLLDGIIKREASVTGAMFGPCLAVLRDGTDMTTEISRKEDEVDRLFLLLLRNICTGNHPGRESVFKAIAGKSMEKISDHIEDIAATAKDSGKDERVAAVFDKASAVFREAADAFAGRDADRKTYSSAKLAFEEECARCEAALRKDKDASKMLLRRSLLDKCNKIVRYCEDIMESASDIVFANPEKGD